MTVLLSIGTMLLGFAIGSLLERSETWLHDAVIAASFLLGITFVAVAL